MWVRRGFFRWLFPAAVLLPAWLVVGWAIFSASGWAFLGILFVAAPAVLIAEVIVALLIRARSDVRDQRAVSWWDVLGITVWHGAVIAFGCFIEPVSFAVLLVAIVAFLGVFWSSLTQLWNGARGAVGRMATGRPHADFPRNGERRRERAGTRAEVFVVHETRRSDDGSGVH